MHPRFSTLILLVAGLVITACSGSSRPDLRVSGPKNPPPPIVKGDDKIFAPADPIAPGPSGHKSPVPGGARDPHTPGNGPGGSKDNGGGGGAPVPEPGTMLLVGTGLAAMALYRRRRRFALQRAP